MRDAGETKKRTISLRWYWIPLLLAPVLVPIALPNAQGGWDTVVFYPFFPTGVSITLFAAKPLSPLAFVGYLILGGTALAFGLYKSPRIRISILIVHFVLIALSVHGCRSVFRSIPH